MHNRAPPCRIFHWGMWGWEWGEFSLKVRLCITELLHVGYFTGGVGEGKV